jgi:hypothetical protein
MRCRHERWLVLSILIAAGVIPAAGLGGCGRADLSAAPAETPVTDEECRALAATIETAVQAGNRAAFSALIDWDEILKRATVGIDVPEASRSGFIQGVKSSMEQEQGLVPQIVGTIKDGGSYKFLRRGIRDGRKTILFRLVTSDSNVANYHEFILGRRPDGKIRAVDAYILLSGELISQSVRRLYIPVAARTAHGLLDRLPGTERVFLKNVPQFERMTTEVRNGHPAEALKIYHQLPPEMKKDKGVLLIRLQAAQDVSDLEYSRAIDDFRATHPDLACVELLSIGYYLLKKDAPRALACIDRFEKALGGDPYLNVTRANIHAEANEYDAARTDARTAIAQDPTLQDAYWTLVTISLQEHQFADTVKLLNQLEDRFHVPLGDMTLLPVFAEFVQSPEYQTWKARPRPKGANTKTAPEPQRKTPGNDRQQPGSAP